MDAGTVPFGKRAVPAPDNTRYRILVQDGKEQELLTQIKALFDRGVRPTRVAAMMNEQKLAPPQGKRWTVSLVYNLKLRQRWQVTKPHNARNHTDQEAKARMTELWSTGRTYQQGGQHTQRRKLLAPQGGQVHSSRVHPRLSVATERGDGVLP